MAMMEIKGGKGRGGYRDGRNEVEAVGLNSNLRGGG
jgi:hypothetical protein